MGGERGGTRTSHPLVPIVTTRTNVMLNTCKATPIPEGIRVAYGRAYIRLKENEGLKSQVHFLIDPYSLLVM